MTSQNRPSASHYPHPKSRPPKLGLLPMLLILLTCPLAAQVQTIDFEQFYGGSLFTSVQPPLTVLGATFSGGAILRNATFATVDTTTIYGTSYFCVACFRTINIDFATPVSNFSMFILNGDPFTVSYTVTDDQNGLQTVSLVSHDSNGAATITLPEANITHVAISPSDPSVLNWDFAIDNVMFKPTTSVIVDPVPALVTDSGITTDPGLLSTNGRIVTRVAADGVTEVVVRVLAGSVGEMLNLVLYNDLNGPAVNPSQDGILSTLNGSPNPSGVMVTAVSTPNGPMAFAVFHAPLDFARTAADSNLTSRNSYIHVQSLLNVNSSAVLTVSIVRPPVFLLHGLWDSAAGWRNFGPLLTDSRFNVSIGDWGETVNGIMSVSPAAITVFQLPITESSLGVAYSAPKVLKQINDFVVDFKNRTSTASIQVDVIAHSMGGLMVKGVRQVSTYASYLNFQKGPIHKVITMGTPHLGSPLALQLLNNQNNCILDKLAAAGLWSFGTVNFGGGVTATGAINDLQGTGTGASLSAFLKGTQSAPAIPLPMALVAGRMTGPNFTGLSSTFGDTLASFARALCPNDLIAQSLQPNSWQNIMGSVNSDAIVPLTSELNNQPPSSPGMQVDGIVHSSGAVMMGFNGPTELDNAGPAPAQAIFLLNEFVTGPDYRPF